MQNLNLKYTLEVNENCESYLHFPEQRVLIGALEESATHASAFNVRDEQVSSSMSNNNTLQRRASASSASSVYYAEMSVLFRKWELTKPTYKQFRVQYPMLRTLTNAQLKKLMIEHDYESYQDKLGNHFYNLNVAIHTYAEFRKQYPAVKNFPNEQLQNYMEVANYKVYRGCRECN